MLGVWNGKDTSELIYIYIYIVIDIFHVYRCSNSSLFVVNDSDNKLHQTTQPVDVDATKAYYCRAS